MGEKKARIGEEKEIKNPGWLDGRSWLARRCFGRKSRNQRAEKSITKEKKFLNQRRKCGVIVLTHVSLDDPNGMESEWTEKKEETTKRKEKKEKRLTTARLRPSYLGQK